MTRQLPIRVSTLVLGVIFAVTLVVYLLVRPQPAVPAQTVHIVLSPTTSARPAPTESRTVQTTPPTTPVPTPSSPTPSPAPTSSALTSGSTTTPGASSASSIPPSPTPG